MSSKNPQLLDDNNIQNIHNKVKYTETDMMADILANSEKLIDREYRKYYDHNEDERNDNVQRSDNNQHNDYQERELDDNIDNYETKYEQPKSNHNQHNPTQDVQQSAKEKTDTKHTENEEESEVDPDDPSKWTKEEAMLRKLDMLRKLGELSQSGVKLSQNYSLHSDYKTMKFEYDLHSGIRSKQNAIGWMSQMMIGIVKGIELLNDNVNPFDIKFEDAWSNKVKTDITSYYDVLGEIYEKYTTPGKKMAPELKLFLMLTGSAVSIQMYKGITNYNSGSSKALDNDKVEELRKKMEHDHEMSEERRENITKKVQAEHEQASKKVADLHMMNNAQNEYAQLNQKIAINPQKYNNLHNSLILSDKSRNSEAPSYASNNFIGNESKLKEKMELIQKNKNLLEIQKMMEDMRKEERLVSENENSRNNKTKTMSESSKKIYPTIQQSKQPTQQPKQQLRQQLKQHQNTPTKKSNSENNSLSMSSVSSASVASSVSSESHKSVASMKSTESTNSRKSVIVENPNISQILGKSFGSISEKKPKLNFDAISFGKKSNGSTATSNKRGTLNIKLE